MSEKLSSPPYTQTHTHTPQHTHTHTEQNYTSISKISREIAIYTT